ncbi:ATP-binding cassette domain-containing protein [Streptomyces sp. BV286]|nr:ATP-binding cassette domain-containing protein [Streptomyces sp. BV286]
MDGPHGLGVTAEDFGLKGPRGWAFRGIGIDAEPGSLIAIEGPSGSGRTCLLLALTGRMKPTEGLARVGQCELPKQMAAVRRFSALAHVPGVTDLEPALSVAEHLRERALLERRFGGSVRGLLLPRQERLTQARLRIDSALAAAGLDREALPKGSRTAVRDLERLEALRLSVALALIGRPRLLGVDDTDLKLSGAERAEVWALLRSLTEAGTTVVVVCSEAPEDALVVPTGPADRPARPERQPGRTQQEPGQDEPHTQDEPAGRAEPPTPDEPTEPHAQDHQDTQADQADQADQDKETVDALAEAGRA